MTLPSHGGSDKMHKKMLIQAHERYTRVDLHRVCLQKTHLDRGLRFDKDLELCDPHIVSEDIY